MRQAGIDSQALHLVALCDMCLPESVQVVNGLWGGWFDGFSV